MRRLRTPHALGEALGGPWTHLIVQCRPSVVRHVKGESVTAFLNCLFLLLLCKCYYPARFIRRVVAPVPPLFVLHLVQNHDEIPLSHAITNLLEGVYCKQAPASTVQPSESTNTFQQPSTMECTDDSTHGATKEFIQFPWKLHEMLDNADVEGFSDIVSWLPGSTNSFKVHQRGVFGEGIMPRYFKKIQFKSFRRQINMWGFERIKSGAGRGGYRHPYFIRGMPSLCCMMKRVKIKGTGTRPSPLLASNGHPCVLPNLRVLETVQTPNYLNPCVLNREKPQDDWFRIHESSLLQFARQVIRLPKYGSAEIFSSDDIAQELISTFSIENEVVGYNSSSQQAS